MKKLIFVPLMVLPFITGCGNKSEPAPVIVTNYKITFEKPNDYPSDLPFPSEQTIPDGGKIAKPESSSYAADYTVNGITKYFEFWENENQHFDFEIEVHSDLTIVAKYSAPYVISFKMPTNYPKNVPVPSTQNIIPGKTVNKPSCLASYTTADGEQYTFQNWLLGKNAYDFTQPVHSSFVLEAYYKI